MYSRYEQVPPNGNVNTFSENRNNIQKVNSMRQLSSTVNRSNSNVALKQSSLNMMNLPKPRPILGREKGNKTSNNLKSNIMSEVTTQSNRDITKIKSFGESEEEKLYVFTGTVERVIKYGKIFQNHLCYFQVLGSVLSIMDGQVQFERKMLLRDKKGPVLQLVYYSNATHINIEDFHLFQNLRAVGRMVGPNIMSAISIRAATEAEMDILPRMCYISDYAVSTLCGEKSNV